MRRRIPTEEEAQQVVKEYETEDEYAKATASVPIDIPEHLLSQFAAWEIQEAKEYYSYCKFMVDGPDASG